ncbi:MAG TPA: methyltransferase domain-containing protein [Blastocatellia bacterium]|nr:methyltransferase domain-containing protein [Blastocatellia bacterium]
MRLLIDIDGTLLTQQKPGDYHLSKPLPGAVEAINKLYDAGHQVVFYTSRNFRYMLQTHEQLREFGFRYHHLEFGKPHADLIIDDRAIRFTSWDEMEEKLRDMLGLEDKRALDEERTRASEDAHQSPDASEEMARLVRLSSAHSYLADFNETLSHYRMKKLDELGCKGDLALELGCGEGLLTRYLATAFNLVEAVDGAIEYIERAKILVPKSVVFHHSLIEEFEPSQQFDFIIAGGLLEHLADPRSVLSRAKQWLTTKGKIIVFVPNALSLNRRLGRAMGLIRDCHELTEMDLKIGHRRMYDAASLRAEIEGAGLAIEKLGGMFLKPLANAQMMSWDKAILDGLYNLSDELPELCTEIYAVCRRND